MKLLILDVLGSHTYLSHLITSYHPHKSVHAKLLMTIAARPDEAPFSRTYNFIIVDEIWMYPYMLMYMWVVLLIAGVSRPTIPKPVARTILYSSCHSQWKLVFKSTNNSYLWTTHDCVIFCELMTVRKAMAYANLRDQHISPGQGPTGNRFFWATGIPTYANRSQESAKRSSSLKVDVAEAK